MTRVRTGNSPGRTFGLKRMRSSRLPLSVPIDQKMQSPVYGPGSALRGFRASFRRRYAKPTGSLRSYKRHLRSNAELDTVEHEKPRQFVIVTEKLNRQDNGL